MLTSAPAQDLISDALLAAYASLIYKQTGIRISPQKKVLLSNRIRRRLKVTNIATFEAYLAYLTKRTSRDPEWDAFLQEVTTHETYLFRDAVHWKWFREEYLPERIRAGETNSSPKKLRIWSAAASTGDEAATIACCIAERLPLLNQWDVKILGTDIGIGALEQARTAVFNDRSMRLVPEDLRRRFFNKVPDVAVWQAKPLLTDIMQFRQHNLIEPLSHEPFNVIFLKNVLIYFDQASKQKVMNHVARLLLPGGYLVAGAAEGISDLTRDFQRVQPWLFRKPEDK